jgi:hypothetical protein
VQLHVPERCEIEDCADQPHVADSAQVAAQRSVIVVVCHQDDTLGMPTQVLLKLAHRRNESYQFSVPNRHARLRRRKEPAAGANEVGLAVSVALQ